MSTGETSGTAAAATATVAEAKRAPLVIVPVAQPVEPTGPPPKKVLVVGDENFLFSAGLQEAYPDWEVTACSVLGRQNLEASNVSPSPEILRGRVRHAVDACRFGKHFAQNAYEGVFLFLPGLSYQVPRELATADRPLFAWRTHLHAFHILRHCKMVLKNEGGKVHLVWPETTNLMSSPCGAAGIEMVQLMTMCGLTPATEKEFELDKIQMDKCFLPWLFGEPTNSEGSRLPEWLHGTQMHSFECDKTSIAIPLSVALFINPDVGVVTIKDATKDASEGPAATAPLRQRLVHEATARKERLKEIYGPKDKDKLEDLPSSFSLSTELTDEDTLLSIPMEIFNVSFDDMPHLSLLLKFQICEDQPQNAITSLDVLDPRLPTRVARPPFKPWPGLFGMNGPDTRKRPRHEEWGGMKFFCQLTQIMTLTPDGMRKHMEGDLYKRFAAATPSWEDSVEKKELFTLLEEAEAMEEKMKVARTTATASSLGSHAPVWGKGKAAGKGAFAQPAAVGKGK